MNSILPRGIDCQIVCVSAGLFFGCGGQVLAADATDVSLDVLDPTPIIEQQPAVDGINFKASALGGAIGGHSNYMVMLSATAPVPYLSSFGAQVDVALGNYRHDYTSAAAGAHVFWRDPSIGLLGIYADWGYVNPEHAGRVGLEGSLYLDRFTIDAFVGKQFGQHVYTELIDEIDLSYYFTDNLRGSIGHRLTSRGNVGNVGFELMPEAWNGWSVFGEAEGGEDDYYGGWLGIRYSFGTGAATTLIGRDRTGDPRVRIPRNIASVTRCGRLPEPKPKNWWRSEMTVLCASEDDLRHEGAEEGKE